MFRFLIALLLAVLILVSGYVGAWYYIANRAQSQLLDGLAEAFGGRVRVGHVALQYDLMRLRFRLSDIEIETAGAAGDLRMVHSFDEALFERALFDDPRQTFTLPQLHKLVLMRGSDPLKTYQVNMVQAQFIFFPEKGGGTLSFQNAVLMEKGRELLRTGFGDVAIYWQRGEKVTLDILLKGLRGQFIESQPDFAFSTLGLNASFAGFPRASHLIVPLLEERTTARLREIGQALVPYLSRNQGNVDMKSFIMRKGQRSLLLSGHLGLDTRARLQGTVAFTVSDKKQFFDFMEQINLLEDGTLNMTPGLTRAVNVMHQPPYVFEVTVNRGDVLIGHSSVGTAVPLPAMLGLTPP
jgi:hypothetical protein